MQRVKVQSSDRSAVITKAVIRAGDQLGLKQKEISDILGLSEATISLMKKGEYFLSEEKKDFEIAALLIRLFRSLDAI
ncbi:transcriptional regulator, XRE family protein, partial [Kiloniella litopenaei]